MSTPPKNKQINILMKNNDKNLIPIRSESHFVSEFVQGDK